MEDKSSWNKVYWETAYWFCWSPRATPFYNANLTTKELKTKKTQPNAHYR